jgi:hypothetical protein
MSGHVGTILPLECEGSLMLASLFVTHRGPQADRFAVMHSAVVKWYALLAEG